MIKRIYLDNNASTAVAPEVKEALIAALESYGNPSSLHEEGRQARALLNQSRAVIAEKLEVKPGEIVFTSGGTESMNTLIRGLLKGKKQGHIISSSAEHACVLESLAALEAEGFNVTYLNPGFYGAVTSDQILEALTPTTVMIVLMAANNETGVITPIEEIAKVAYQHQIPFAVDGVCAFGKIDLKMFPGISGIGFSAHKFHAPKGVGFFALHSKAPFSPLIVGGEQEQSRRGGTVAAPLIAAMAMGVKLLSSNYYPKIGQLRDLFEKLLKERIPGVEVNGEGPRICNTSNLYFPGVEGETLIQQLDMRGIACSHGSACSSGALEPAKVLIAMGYPRKRVISSIRFSLSRMTTEEEVLAAVEIIVGLVSA